MLKYKFIKPNKTIIEINIELANTGFVNLWKTYMLNLYNRLPNIVWYITRHNNNLRYLSHDKLIVNLSRLHASFLFFNNKKIDNFNGIIERIEYLFEHPKETTQQDLNHWHRQFTRLINIYAGDPDITPPNTLHMDLVQYIHDVNQYVHKCEAHTYADCDRRKPFVDSPMYAVQFTNANNIELYADNDNRKVWNGSTPEIASGIFDWNKESTDYTVWLHEDIIGKDQMKAWLDHDNLGAFDITGNLGWTPNVTFDPKKVYNRICQDPSFRAESIASGKTLDRPPLGNVINIENINFDDILDAKVYSIELDGKLLWNNTDPI